MWFRLVVSLRLSAWLGFTARIHHFKFILRSSNGLESRNSELRIRILIQHIYLKDEKKDREGGEGMENKEGRKGEEKKKGRETSGAHSQRMKEDRIHMYVFRERLH
jgi:hypothetical protein